MFGAGLGAFGTAAGETTKERRQLRAHTAPIAVASELGGVGVVCLLFIGITLVRTRRVRIADRARRRTRLIVAVLLFTIVVHSLTYNALFEDPATWALAAWLALLTTLQPRAEPLVVTATVEADPPAVEAPAAAAEPVVLTDDAAASPGSA